MSNNLAKFSDWAVENDHGNVHIPIQAIEIFSEYLKSISKKEEDSKLLSTAIFFTGYFDDKGFKINVGSKVYIACNPYHGEYIVKFGEYQHRNFTKHDRQVVHCGLYLDNGKDKISLANAMTKPTGCFNSIHMINIVS